VASKTIKALVTLVERVPDGKDADGKDKFKTVDRPPGTQVTLPADEADRILAHKEWGAEEVRAETTDATPDANDGRRRR
jgi:hypothetical protein